jgi:hypothetical protein
MTCGADKRPTLKVQGARGTKKQKTPVKTTIKEAIKTLMQDDTLEGELEAKMEVDLANGAASPRSKRKQLTSTLNEACQEQ